MPVDPARAKSLFLTASELADPVNRAAYLDRECGGDTELRARVEALLRANDAAPLPPVVAATMDSEHGHPQKEDFDNPTAQVGVVIAGKYTLAEVIGEGGMGTVWRAKQSEPVNRFVALKLIKAGMDSRQVLARFDAERQALALMDHPNIAKVLDGGLHDHQPFFVMELVKGLPITEYCDSQKLTPQRRLELFVSVCQAIQHAHQKGIIHRDIKPSNVLVALYDDKPVVKVIDFGVAKPTGGALTEATIDTGFGSVVGTPEYMSPEQATFNNLDIDTRSDVYALGVLLYELLAGSPPFSKRELEKKGLLEMLRVVREEEPPRPSTKLSTADALPSLSANRGTEPKKLTGLLRNELDWIVMKALEKERSRRYETANGFAADVQRYLAGEPVQAHPPSKFYRVNKFVRRNKPQVIAASLVLLALIAGVIGTTVGLIEAKKQEQKALAAAEQARKATQQVEIEKSKVVKAAEAERVAKLDADAKREEAVRNLAFARKGNELLGSVFAGLDPKKIAESGRPLQDVLRENLVTAVKELEGSAIGDPLEVAAMQNTLGQSLMGLGEFGLAIQVLAKAHNTRKSKLGHEAPNTLTSMTNLAEAYQAAGQLDQALPLLEEALKFVKATFGPNDPNTSIGMNNLALGYQAVNQLDQAIPLFEETLKLMRAQFGPDHSNTLACMNNLALSYHSAGKVNEALPLFEETLKLMKAKFGPDHPDTLNSMHNLATGYRDAGQLDQALPLFEETLKLMKAKLGPDHPDTLICMGNLAGGYQNAEKFDLALRLFEETLRLRKAKLDPDHPHTLVFMDNLASGYLATGQLDQALPLFEETLKLSKAKLGPNHLKTLVRMNNLGLCYRDAGQLDQALPLFEETLKLMKAKLGVDHFETLTCMQNLALSYRDTGELNLALPLFEETLKRMKAQIGPDHHHTLNCMGNLALGYKAAGKLGLALPLYEETFKLRKAKHGPDHRHTLVSMNNLALTYKAVGKLDLALPLFEETLKLRKAKLSPGHPDLLVSMNNLARGYQAAGQLDQALPLFEETLTLMKSQLGPDHLDTLRNMSNLAITYQTAGKLDLALPLYEETLKLRKAKLGPNHPDTLASMNSLASAYYAAGKLKTNLDPLQGLQLTKLHLWQWSGTDLAPLKGMPLNWLNCGGGGQKLDLTPLAELPLDFLCLNHTQVSDLGPLKDVPLTTLLCSNTQVTDLMPVRKMRLRELALVNGKVSDLSPLQGMPLEHLEIEGARVTDLTPLKGMPLKYLSLTPANILRGMEILRGMKSLERIGIGENQVWPAMEFWARYDQGEFEPKNWSAFHAQSLIGAGLLGQKNYADAEQLLLKGYEGMKAHEKTIPQEANTRIPEALDRLIELYTDTDKPEEAQKWQAERAKYPPAATAVPEKD